MQPASRAPTVFVVGIVLLTTVLLVAGFGVQIGIGVIVGALLGVAWIGALLAMNPRTSGGAGYVSWSGAGSSARPPGHEVIERYHRDWMRVAAVDASELRRVIAVGRSVQAADVRAELVAVEIREDGGVAGIVTHTRPPVGQTGHFVEVTVTDDRGTEYAAAGQGSGGGGTGASRYDIRFSPTPPSDASVLTLRVASFTAPFPGPVERLTGPWEFEIRL